MSTGKQEPTQLSEATITEQVIAIVRTKTPHPVTADSTLDSVGLDSLAMAEIIFEIESQFKIRADERLLDLRSFREVINYVVQALKKRGGV